MGQNSNRVITTGVPFLMITPDARAAGMGDLGVATPADAYSQQWNPAKYAFVFLICLLSEDLSGGSISFLSLNLLCN